jgi:hypothetical protein
MPDYFPSPFGRSPAAMTARSETAPVEVGLKFLAEHVSPAGSHGREPDADLHPLLRCLWVEPGDDPPCEVIEDPPQVRLSPGRVLLTLYFDPRTSKPTGTETPTELPPDKDVARPDRAGQGDPGMTVAGGRGPRGGASADEVEKLDVEAILGAVHPARRRETTPGPPTDVSEPSGEPFGEHGQHLPREV